MESGHPVIISAIAAASENHVIGGNNELLWHLPEDFKYFKKVTLGHPVIMGRKTYESMGKPLPKRENIVITSRENYQAPGCKVFQSLEKAIDYARQIEQEEIFIIGGGEIYRQSLPLLDKIYLTRVHTIVEGDTYFPEIDPREWRLTEKFLHPEDEKHAYAFTFEVYKRITD